MNPIMFHPSNVTSNIALCIVFQGYGLLVFVVCYIPTKTPIEFYHGALKHWFSLETKGLRRRRIDWLIWRLTTMVARHYMHTSEMKERGFIKNKVVERLVKASVDKGTLIPLTM